jgi:hypothetical protein
MSDYDNCNCEQALALQQRVAELEAQLAATKAPGEVRMSDNAKELERRLRERAGRQYLGHWPAGTRVRLGEWSFADKRDPGRVLPGREVVIVRGCLPGGGFVTVRDVETGAQSSPDAFDPVWSGPGYLR